MRKASIAKSLEEDALFPKECTKNQIAISIPSAHSKARFSIPGSRDASVLIEMSRSN